MASPLNMVIYFYLFKLADKLHESLRKTIQIKVILICIKNEHGSSKTQFCIQLFRETLSEKSTKLHKPIPKGSMGRRIELLHVLHTNVI